MYIFLAILFGIIVAALSAYGAYHRGMDAAIRMKEEFFLIQKATILELRAEIAELKKRHARILGDN